jgi:Flp pilus assembly protein TadB
MHTKASRRRRKKNRRTKEAGESSKRSRKLKSFDGQPSDEGEAFISSLRRRNSDGVKAKHWRAGRISKVVALEPEHMAAVLVLAVCVFVLCRDVRNASWLPLWH